MEHSLTRAANWEKTNNFRLHRYVTSYSWSNNWDANFTETLQQQLRCMETGETKWEPVEIVTEEAPNTPRYG